MYAFHKVLLAKHEISGFLHFPHTLCFVPLGITSWNSWMLIMKRHSGVHIALVSLYSPSISSLLTSWKHVVPCPSKYAPLLSTLATASPVCALLPPTPSNLNLMDKLTCGYNVRFVVTVTEVNSYPI